MKKKRLCIYNGLVTWIYEDCGKYYFTNSKGDKKEVKKADLVILG